VVADSDSGVNCVAAVLVWLSDRSVGLPWHIERITYNIRCYVITALVNGTNGHPVPTVRHFWAVLYASLGLWANMSDDARPFPGGLRSSSVDTTLASRSYSAWFGWAGSCRRGRPFMTPITFLSLYLRIPRAPFCVVMFVR